jgi:uncharacterized membrane protein
VYSVLLFTHFVGLALGVGTSFTFARVGAAMRDVPVAERAAFFRRLRGVSKNGGIGLGLLIFSGVGMMALRGFGATFAWGGPAFHAKLTLVVILSGLFGYQQVLSKRATFEPGDPATARIPKVGAALLLLGLCIVAAAVAAFQ